MLDKPLCLADLLRYMRFPMKFAIQGDAKVLDLLFVRYGLPVNVERARWGLPTASEDNGYRFFWVKV